MQLPNARLRGWQRKPLNSNTTTDTAAAHWDWKRHALAVPLEAFVMCVFQMQTLIGTEWWKAFMPNAIR
ncbi:DUF1196 domain-containing protein [Vibrio cholerae]|nr:DUF1196 domain-containing protein [Vibrio cholerae]